MFLRVPFLLWIAAAVVLAAALLDGRDEPVRPDGRVVVRYWEKWNGFEAEAMRQLVDDFNRSQEGIFVEYLSVSQLDRKLALAVAGGVPPDLAGLWSYAIPVYAENGALLPLDERAAAHGLREDAYLPAIWRNVTHRGRLWAVPTTPSTLALHWNKKLFREAGLDPERPPRSIRELEEFNERIARRDAEGRLTVLGHLPSEPGWWLPLWGLWFGGQLWDGNDRPTVQDPGNRAALEWVRSYPERFGRENLMAFQDVGGTFASPQNPFFQNRIAMVLQGPWMHNFIRSYAPADFEWGVAPFPSSDPAARSGVTLVECDTLVIPKGARHPDAAFAFMRWLQRPANLEKLCLGQRKFSPLQAASDRFYRDHPNPHIRVFADLAASPNAHVFPRLVNWTEYKNDLLNAYHDVALMRRTPAEALAEVERRQDRLARKRAPQAAEPALSALSPP